MSRDPVEITPDLLRRMRLPDPEGDKEGRGRVMVVGGSRETPGAILLAGHAALRVGAGKLQIATLAGAAPHLAAAMPEARLVPLPETEGGAIDPACGPGLRDRALNCAALAIGPGTLDEEASSALAAALLDGDGPGAILDAAAMAVARAGFRPGRVAITPHAGEMAHLAGAEKAEVEADAAGFARRAAERFGCVVALKGAATHVAAPDGRAWIFRGGSIGLATSGSGDVLAGAIGGLLARGLQVEEAVIWGICLHGKAGDRLARSVGPLGYLARELPGEIPAAMAELG